MTCPGKKIKKPFETQLQFTDTRRHNAVADDVAHEDFKFFLTNVTNRPVNLPKGYVVGHAKGYHGPLCEVPEEEYSPFDEGADPMVAALPLNLAEMETPTRAGEDPPPPDGASPTTGHHGIDDSKAALIPKIAYNLIPTELHGAVRDWVSRHKGLWDGKLGRMDITPHRIALSPGAKPVR